MTVRELARRASQHLRSVQLAVDRLVRTGIIERVGTGSHQQVQLNEQHPLAKPLQMLFESERSRFDRIINALRNAAKKYASRATAIWAVENTSTDGSTLEVEVLAGSKEVDTLIDALRKPVGQLMRREDVNIELRGWTRADLEALDWSPLSQPSATILLWGALPHRVARDRRPNGSRSHADADETLLDRAKRAAKALERHPELVRKARVEVAKRLESATAGDAKTLLEWQDVLETMSIPRLQRWLAGRSGRATRLRQSMPFVFLQAAEEQVGSKRGKS